MKMQVLDHPTVKRPGRDGEMTSVEMMVEIDGRPVPAVYHLQLTPGTDPPKYERGQTVDFVGMTLAGPEGQKTFMITGEGEPGPGLMKL